MSELYEAVLLAINTLEDLNELDSSTDIFVIDVSKEIDILKSVIMRYDSHGQI